MPFDERSLDLLDDRHCFNDRVTYYAPCIVMDFVDNVEKLLEGHSVKPFLSAPFIIFLITMSFAYSRHKSSMYSIEKSRYARLHYLWHWFDEQTKIERKLRLPVRLWFNRPLWYTYREFTEGRSKRSDKQPPGYQFMGWPDVFYISKKKMRFLNMLSIAISFLTVFSMCITATQVLVLEPQTYASGLMADTFLEFNRWNFTNSGKVEYCGREERFDEMSVQAMVEQAALFMLKEMKFAGANIISRVCFIFIVLACLLSLLYSRSVTFASGLDRPRFASRPYDRQFKCGRTKEGDPRGTAVEPPPPPAPANPKIKELTAEEKEKKEKEEMEKKEKEEKEKKEKEEKEKKEKEEKENKPPTREDRREQAVVDREHYFDVDQFFDDGTKVQLTDGTERMYRVPMAPVAKQVANPVETGKTVEPKNNEPQKAEPKKAEQTKTEPKKAEPKKAEPKKAEPKKAEPKKAEPQRKAAAGDGKPEEAKKPEEAEKPEEAKQPEEKVVAPQKKYRMPGDYLLAEQKEIALPMSHLMAYYMHFLYPCFIGAVIAFSAIYDTSAFRKSFLFIGE